MLLSDAVQMRCKCGSKLSEETHGRKEIEFEAIE